MMKKRGLRDFGRDQPFDFTDCGSDSPGYAWADGSVTATPEPPPQPQWPAGWVDLGWVERDQVPCKLHPDAPHGFDRNLSHTLDRYVCECEHWSPEP